VKTLVTGATGFVGSHLAELLRRRGDEVVALVRSPARAAALRELGVTLVAGDLGDPGALAEAVRGVELVHHVAGLTAARDEAEFRAVNVAGTARLLEAAAAAGARRFVLVSSLAAAGPSARGRRRASDEPEDPVTAYGRSKAEAEALVRAGPVPWTIARPPAVYGPRDVELLKVFKLARWGVAPVFGEGTQELSLVYGPDLAEALAAMGTTAAAEGRIYYPAHPEVVTSGDLVRAIGRSMGRQVRLLPLPRPLAGGILQVTGWAARLAGRATLLNPDKANEFFQPAWTCDPAVLTSETGWRAAHDLEDPGLVPVRTVGLIVRSRLAAVDRLLLGYLAITGLVALARLPTRPATGWVVVINLLIGLLVVLLAHPRAAATGRWCRDWYPLLLLPALYGSLDLLNGLGNVRVWDTEILALERLLFGGEPAREWWQRHPSRFWSTILHGAYWLYYLILPFPVAWFAITRQREALRHTVRALAVTFLACYLVFLFMPVAGPYYQYPRPSAEFLDNPMARLVYGTLSTGSSYGAAFPSSHVAATIVAMVTAWRGDRRAGAILLPPALLLVVGVVYCQMHYAVDAVAGVAVAAAVLAVTPAAVPAPEPASGTPGPAVSPRSP